MLRRFAKFFSVNFESQMRLFKIFLNLCCWFLKNKSGVNFLGIITKLTLVCSNANTVFLNTVFLKVFIQLFLKFLSNNILFYPSYLGSAGLISLQPMLHLLKNQAFDLFALVKSVKSDIEKNCH